MPDLLTLLHNSLDPFYPLPPGDQRYVDCNAVRGDADIRRELGKKILRSDRHTYQLYTGHTGAGKSTELLRLKDHLQDNGCVVVYFAAGPDDQYDLPDVELPEILLTCARYLIEELQALGGDPGPLMGWLKNHLTEAKDLALSDIVLDNLTFDIGLGELIKINAQARQDPRLRRQLRDLLNPQSVPLIEQINTIIRSAKLPQGKSKLVMIADNLEKIVVERRDDGSTNYDEIFVDRCEQLKGLECHIIYTAPLAMMYSQKTVDIPNLYDAVQILPMVMVNDHQGNPYLEGIKTLKALIDKRLRRLEG